MTEIIPTIIAHDFKDLEEKINKLAPYVDWIQLDVMDSQFVENITWYRASDLKNLNPEILKKVDLEAHLMIWEPEKIIDFWIASGVKRIIFHYEATHQREEVIEKIKKANLEVGIAIDLPTPAAFIEKFISDIDLVLIMSVKAGKGGQEFRPESISKISYLRQKYPDLKIAVDGGINPETGKKCLEAGADILCAGSYILESTDIAQTIEGLKNIKI